MADLQHRFVDSPPSWVGHLMELGFDFLGSEVVRTLSPYVDADAGRRMTYFEILFEWTEGSDGPDEDALVDPWSV